MKSFDCTTCGVCCYGEGGIVLEAGEGERVARSLGVPFEVFKKRYTETRNGIMSVITGSDNYCIFYHAERKCLIHTAKPLSCRLWPFYPANVRSKENWELARDACPGLRRKCSFDDFVNDAKAVWEEEGFDAERWLRGRPPK